MIVRLTTKEAGCRVRRPAQAKAVERPKQYGEMPPTTHPIQVTETVPIEMGVPEVAPTLSSEINAKVVSSPPKSIVVLAIWAFGVHECITVKVAGRRARRIEGA